MTGTTEQLADGIARELGGLRGETWTTTEGYFASQRYLNGPGQALLLFSSDQVRAEISTSYPESNTRGENLGLSASLARGPLAIARDINRKIMPGYLAELGRVLAWNRDEQAKHEGRTVVLNQAAELFGATFERPGAWEPGQSGAHKDSLSLRERLPGAAFGTVEAYGEPDKLNLDLHHIPADVALRMLAVLAESTSREAAR